MIISEYFSSCSFLKDRSSVTGFSFVLKKELMLDADDVSCYISAVL